MRSWRRALRAIWPNRLAAQLIALLLFALVASQIVSLVILLDERRHALRAAERAQVLARTASIVRLMEATPPALHPHILSTASSPRLRFWLDGAAAVDGTLEVHRHNPLQERLDDLLGGSARQVLVELSDEKAKTWDWFERRRDGDADGSAEDGVEDRRPLRAAAALERPRRAHRAWQRMSLIASVQLADGRWLNVETGLPRGLGHGRATVLDQHGRDGGGDQRDRGADDPPHDPPDGGSCH